VLDFVVEHQRQAGQADDEQEDRTDQTGPLVEAAVMATAGRLARPPSGWILGKTEHYHE
jgi:hypothetical protein